MLVKNNTVHIYYTGTNVMHGEKRRTPTIQVKTGNSLATLPADRFVALRPGPDDGAGMLQTQPLPVPR